MKKAPCNSPEDQKLVSMGECVRVYTCVCVRVVAWLRVCVWMGVRVGVSDCL